MGLVEVPEQRAPCLFGRRLAGQLHHGLYDHAVGFGLIVPAVFHPESCLAVPAGYSRRVNPCHTSRMNAAPLAHRLVRNNEEPGLPPVELAEEQAVAVDGVAEQLDSR